MNSYADPNNPECPRTLLIPPDVSTTVMPPPTMTPPRGATGPAVSLNLNFYTLLYMYVCTEIQKKKNIIHINFKI